MDEQDPPTDKTSMRGSKSNDRILLSIPEGAIQALLALVVRWILPISIGTAGGGAVATSMMEHEVTLSDEQIAKIVQQIESHNLSLSSAQMKTIMQLIDSRCGSTPYPYPSAPSRVQPADDGGGFAP